MLQQSFTDLISAPKDIEQDNSNTTNIYTWNSGSELVSSDYKQGDDIIYTSRFHKRQRWRDHVYKGKVLNIDDNEQTITINVGQTSVAYQLSKIKFIQNNKYLKVFIRIPSQNMFVWITTLITSRSTHNVVSHCLNVHINAFSFVMVTKIYIGTDTFCMD